MKKQDLKFVREQLDKKLEQYQVLKNITIPQKGWIRAIRDSLGMSMRQLADRLHVSKPRIARIEKDEIRGNLTIKSMHSIAEALNCQFVYGFVPNTTLKNTVRTQAVKIITDRMNNVSQHMLLEKQDIPNEEQNKLIEYEIEELINQYPRTLWDYRGKNYN